ncbi:hypothetical protein AAEX28_05385 [Lentisphaerota bacterium WC36G]|nr:hypothetical protein LJT99_08240 [Lentisphaerae bacterium WC36]
MNKFFIIIIILIFGVAGCKFAGSPKPVIQVKYAIASVGSSNAMENEKYTEQLESILAKIDGVTKITSYSRVDKFVIYVFYKDFSMEPKMILAVRQACLDFEKNMDNKKKFLRIEPPVDEIYRKQIIKK